VLGKRTEFIYQVAVRIQLLFESIEFNHLMLIIANAI